jgi:antitoxin VapB
MAQLEKAEVFMSGRSQAVRIPAKFRFATNEVYIRRDPKSGALIFSQAQSGLQEIFDAFDRLGLPKDIVSTTDRDQQPPQDRGENFMAIIVQPPRK